MAQSEEYGCMSFIGNEICFNCQTRFTRRKNLKELLNVQRVRDKV